MIYSENKNIMESVTIDLSIIIPVYNCASHLNKGFRSLEPLYSGNFSFEIIYINDGSTDNSLSVIQSFQKNYDFISIINQENQGSSGARNSGLDVAKGNYIQFLDADDFLDIENVLSMLETAISEDIDLLGYRLDFVNSNGNKTNEMEKFHVKYDTLMSGREALISGYNPSSICMFLFKSSFLDKNNLRLIPRITHMDVEFMLRAMLCANKVFFVDRFAYHYVQRIGSITKPRTMNSLQKYLFDEVVVAGLMKQNLNSTMSKELKTAVVRNYNSVVWNLLWSFLINRDRVNYEFKVRCMNELKRKNLYPIKGELKTVFQRITRIMINFEGLLLK